MHHTTAKLIMLERTDAFVAYGWPKGSQAEFAEQAKALRQEIPPHFIAVYDRLKIEHREAVVGVFEEKCGGCHASLSKTALKRVSEETEVSRCEHCGRFIYLTGGHDLASHDDLPRFADGHGRR